MAHISEKGAFRLACRLGFVAGSRELKLTLFQFRDVGIDHHRPAVAGLAFVDLNPSPVLVFDRERPDRLAEPFESPIEPRLPTHWRRYHVVLDDRPQDRLHRCARLHDFLDVAQEEIAIAAVRCHQLFTGVEESEALGLTDRERGRVAQGKAEAYLSLGKIRKAVRHFKEAEKLGNTSRSLDRLRGALAAHL